MIGSVTAAMDPEWINAFREKLDKYYAWPSLYTFKFIILAEKEGDLRELFPLHTSTAKSSEKGKYISLTYQMMMPSSDSVIAVYQKVSVIEGIVAL